jgi:hypothetical protein
VIGDVNALPRKAPSMAMPAFARGEERHDHIARPGVEALLQPLVGGRCRPELHSRHVRQLGRRLLAELPEPVAHALKGRTGRRVRVGQEAQRQSDDDGLDPRLEHRHPGGGPERRKGEAGRHHEAAGDEDRSEEGNGNE